jgi:hypothetical protein
MIFLQFEHCKKTPPDVLARLLKKKKDTRMGGWWTVDG